MINMPPSGRAESALGFEHTPAWRIFRIMSEFVDGFTFLAGVHLSVTIFGSARLPESHPYYQKARTLGQLLARDGFTVVTGGGPGIMQASNQGAHEAGGDSVGLNIELPHEQRINPFVRRSKSFHYFFSRKVMLDFSAEAYVFFPGGYGTLDEFFELVTLVQTGKVSSSVPIIMIGTDYWGPLAEWMEQTLVKKFHTIAAHDLKIWTLTDDVEEAARIIKSSVAEQAERRLATFGRAGHTAEEKLGQATQQMTGGEQ
jgi:uncharacterized protein (TIGR00730 family)